MTEESNLKTVPQPSSPPNPPQAVRKLPPGASGSRQQPPADGTLNTGDLVAGGRFKVERYLGASPTAVNYACTDTESAQPVVLKLIRKQLDASPADFEEMSKAVGVASSIKTQGLVSVLGMGTVSTGDPFIVMDYVQGPSLGYIISEHRKSGKTVGVRDAYAVISHLCYTLDLVHKTLLHTVITPYNIHLTRAGTILLSNLGFAGVMAEIEARNLGTGPYIDSIYVAPEVTELPDLVSSAADIYSLGMITVEMLQPKGLSADRAIANSEAQAFLSTQPKELKNFLLAAINPDMMKRPKSAIEFVQNFEVALQKLGVTVLVEPGPDNLPIRAMVSRGMTDEELFDLPEFDIPQSDSADARYLLQIRGLDYGPFSEAEVFEKLYADEINENTEILDRTTQERCLLQDSPPFREKVLAYIPERDERIRRAAEQREKNIQRVKTGGIGIFVVGILVGAVILGVLGFFLYRLPDPEPLPVAIAIPKQDYLFSPPPKDFVEVAVDKSFLESLFNPKASDKEIAKKLKRRPTKGKGAAGKKGGPEENITEVDLMAAGGTNHVLTDEEVYDVIVSDFAALRSCIQPELSKNPSFKGVSVKFYVRPSGSPGGVQIKEKNHRSSQVGKCLVNRFRTMRFPAHGGFNKGVVFPFYVQ